MHNFHSTVLTPLIDALDAANRAILYDVSLLNALQLYQVLGAY